MAAPAAQHRLRTSSGVFAGCFLAAVCLLVQPVYLGLGTMCWHHVTGDLALLHDARVLSKVEADTFSTKVASSNHHSPTQIGDIPAILKATSQ